MRLPWLLLIAAIVHVAEPRASKRGRKGSKQHAAHLQGSGESSMPGQLKELYSAGDQRLSERRLDEALSFFNKAMDLAGQSPPRELYEKRSKTLGLLGRWSEALSDGDAALAMYSDAEVVPHQHLMRSIVLQQLNRKHEATESARTAVQLHRKRKTEPPMDMLVTLCVMMFEVREMPADGGGLSTSGIKGLEENLLHCKGAIASATDRVNRNQDDARAIESLSTAHHNTALVLLSLGDRMYEARSHADAAASLRPGHQPLAKALAAAAEHAGAALPLASTTLHRLWPRDGKGWRGPFHAVSGKELLSRVCAHY